jgi:hypothetical protein
MTGSAGRARGCAALTRRKGEGYDRRRLPDGAEIVSAARRSRGASRSSGLLALVLVAWPASRAWGQATATTGQIEGAVADESGAVLPGAIVTARNTETGFERSSTSDAAGAYRLGLLPLGPYELSARLEGFADLKRAGLRLQVGETLSLPLYLKLASVEETVSVTADAPAVEVARSLSAVTINESSISSLPINGRRFQDLVLLTPGAVVENQRGGTAIGGQRGINASYALDGASYDNPFFGGIKGGERSNLAYTISQEAIREFQVSNAGYSAEFGRSGGGVVNAITKSGTNDLHGTAFWYFRSEGLQADDPFGRPPTDFRQHQFGASLGGPLKRDKAHFFLAYDQQLRSNPLVVDFGPASPSGAPGFDGEEGRFEQANDVWTALARLDHRLSEGHNVWLRYNWSRNEGRNGLGTSPTTSAISNNALEKDGQHTLVAQLSSVLSPNLHHVVRVQFSREDRPRQPNATSPTISVTGLGTSGRVTFLPSIEQDDRLQIVDNFTVLRGSHSLRAGLDLNFLHIKQPFFLSRSGGEYRFSSVADYVATASTGVQRWRDYRQGFGRADVDFWQQDVAFYVQDTWKLRRNLTLNYGLRYEAQFQPTPDDPNPNLPQSDRIPDDTDNFGPRLGVAWDPWDDSKGVVRANVGYFYSRTPALLLVSPFTNNGRAQLQLTFLPTSPGAPIFPNVLQAPPSGIATPRTDANVFDPDFQNPRTLQLSVGVEREVLTDLSLGIDYAHNRGRNLERLFDINISPASGAAAEGRPLYRSPRPDPAFNRILEAQSTARSDYRALTLSAKRRFRGGTRWYNRGLQFQAFYTYARARDDDSNERNFSGLFYQDFENLAAEYTWSSNDVRHNFVGNVTWSFAWDVQLAAIFVARSGLPYSHLANQDLNGDGDFGNDRQFVNGADTGRNAFRQPSFERLDLRLQKSVKLGGARALELAVDVFNLLDSDNLFVNATNSNFLGPSSGSINPNLDVPNAQSGDPRTAQISARFRF